MPGLNLGVEPRALVEVRALPPIAGKTRWMGHPLHWLGRVGHPPSRLLIRLRCVVSHSTTMKLWLNGALRVVAG